MGHFFRVLVGTHKCVWGRFDRPPKCWGTFGDFLTFVKIGFVSNKVRAAIRSPEWRHVLPLLHQIPAVQNTSTLRSKIENTTLAHQTSFTSTHVYKSRPGRIGFSFESHSTSSNGIQAWIGFDLICRDLYTWVEVNEPWLDSDRVFDFRAKGRSVLYGRNLMK